MYGFGDSLVYGHHIGIGMLDFVAEKNKMEYWKFAINGATVIPGIAQKLPDAILVPDIAEQIAAAPEKTPDFICFDGMTNDAYPLVVSQYLGEVSTSYAGKYDVTTFCGAFENICYQLRKKYCSSQLIYICPHKMPTREWEVQETLHNLAESICRKWSVSFLDIYSEGGINTYIPQMRIRYSYNNIEEQNNGNGTHLNEDGYRFWYAPLIEAELARHNR